MRIHDRLHLSIPALIFSIALVQVADRAAAHPPPADCQSSLGDSQLPDITPVIARPREKPFDDPDYQFEMKYDGYRGVMYFERGRGCRILSRNDNPLTQFQRLCDAVATELKVENAIFDGEVIAYDEANRPVFNQLQRRKEPFQYVAFDLMWLNGNDLRKQPLRERRRLLLEVLPKRSKAITEALAMTGKGTRMFELMIEHDLEGIVAKRLESTYSRSARWYKIKNRSYSQAVGRGRFF